jgi:hypothetical protein
VVATLKDTMPRLRPSGAGAFASRLVGCSANKFLRLSAALPVRWCATVDATPKSDWNVVSVQTLGTVTVNHSNPAVIVWITHAHPLFLIQPERVHIGLDSDCRGPIAGNAAVSVLLCGG